MEETLRNGGLLLRAEIDTSAPFESVKEAVNKFGGGLGFWKPSLSSSDMEEADVAKIEEQAAELEKDLKLKERDTLEVLKELEATKVMVKQLKSKLQNEDIPTKPNIDKENAEEKENNPNFTNLEPSSSSPSVILMELKQAKWNLTKTTNDLTEIRASVESYNKKIERERTSLEKTRERLRLSTSKISSLEDEISQTKSKIDESDQDIMVELQRLNNEAEKYMEIGEVAKSEVMKVMLQIEQTKAKVKTAEIRLVAARKMKEAAKAAELVALAEIKALEETSSTEKITLTHEEYSLLKRKAREAEDFSNLKVVEAMFKVDEANESKVDIMKKVEESMEEVKTSKKALEDALDRVEAANNDKLEVEEALRKWSSENGEKRWSTQNNNTKFKNSSSRKRDTWMVECAESAPVLKPTLSIGQILSRKLLITEEYGPRKSTGKRKVSLGQMLGKQTSEMSSAWKMDKDGGNNHGKLNVKRKKFGFARFSVLLPKQSLKKKKKPSPMPTPRLNFLASGCKGNSLQVNEFVLQKI